MDRPDYYNITIVNGIAGLGQYILCKYISGQLLLPKKHVHNDYQGEYCVKILIQLAASASKIVVQKNIRHHCKKKILCKYTSEWLLPHAKLVCEAKQVLHTCILCK